MERRVLSSLAVVVCVFNVGMWMLLWHRAPHCSYRSPVATSSGEREDLMGEVSFWMDKWQEQLRKRGDVLPASLAFSSPKLEKILQQAQGRVVHATSYHFPHGGLLDNWKGWLRLQSGSTATTIAFVPSTRGVSSAEDVDGVMAVDAGSLLQPFALCQRDPGSGIKVRAVLDLLRRGYDVMYSDADVVWMKSPAMVEAEVIRDGSDFAFQIYDASDLKNGNFGVNFGLFFARSNDRARHLLRKVFREMIHSFSLRGGSFDTCNDQNNLQAVLKDDLVCSYCYKGKCVSVVGANKEKCVKLTLLDVEEYPTATPFILRGMDKRNVGAVHMTGYWGGHTFAKAFAMKEYGLWWKVEGTPARVLEIDSLSFSLGMFKAAVAAALVSERALVIPNSFACPPSVSRRGCSVDFFLNVERMLELNRALQGSVGMRGSPDIVDSCCRWFVGKFPYGLTVSSMEVQGGGVVCAGMEELRSLKSERNVRLASVPALEVVMESMNTLQREATQKLLDKYFVEYTGFSR